MKSRDTKSAINQNYNKKKRFLEYSELKWLLSAYSFMAAVYNKINIKFMCENCYIKYVSIIEDFFLKDSIEAANAYFQMGLYYFESKLFKKSLACFIKALYIRQTDLGEQSLGSADCHYNMAVIYKVLEQPD